MKYVIKCIAGIHSKGEFSIQKGQELEVSKEIYDYFNNNFGASGRFNFSTKEGTKKATPKTETPTVVDEKPKKDTEVKVVKKATKSTK